MFSSTSSVPVLGESMTGSGADFPGATITDWRAKSPIGSVTVREAV
jgi:hypothetical protein